MGYDGKYGRVTTEHGDIPDEEPVVVFRARDMLTPSVLDSYYTMCKAVGSPQRHLDLIEATRLTFVEWQTKHGHRVPASEGSRAWLPADPPAAS
jgi:hypothetical protein